MLTEYLINIIILLLALAIYISPIALIVLVIICFIKRNNKNKQHIHSPSMQYSTGWKWNERTQLWEPPGYKEPEIKVDRSRPTYEEWKTAREQEQTRDQQHTEQSAYHYTSSQLPKDETTIYKTPTITYERKYHQSAYQTPPASNSTYGSNRNRTWDQSFWEAEQEKKEQPTYKEPKVGHPKTKPKPQPKPQEKPTPSAQTVEYQDAYEAVNILTRNESENYKKLKIAADRKGYIICPKVRLADIVKPRNDPQYMSRFGKIKSKHVDFVIYDGDMRHLKAVIELDDKSHDRKDRQERDEFVDFILTDCGYRVIHTRYITPDILDDV